MNRYFVFAWIIGFALHVGQDVFNSYITVFANNNGYSNTFAGSLSMGYLAGALIGRRVGGWVTDLRGRRGGVLLGTSVFLGATLLFCLPAAQYGIIMMILRFLHGFGYACATTAYYVIVDDVVPKEKSSVGLGLNFTGQGLAFSFGGILIGAFASGDSYTMLYLVTSAFVLVSVLFSATENYEKGRSVAHRAEKTSKRSFLEPAAIPYAVIILVYYVSLALPLFYLGPLALEKGIEDWSNVLSCFAAGMIVGYLIFPKIYEKANAFMAMLPVYLAGALGLIIFLWTKSEAVFNTAGILYGLTIASVPVMQTAAVRDVPDDRKGNATATLNSAIDLTMGVGPLFWGILIDQCGFALPFILGAVLYIAALFVHLYVENSRKKQSSPI